MSAACSSLMTHHSSLKKKWSGSISRILSSLPSEDHSSATRVAAVVEQPTRKLVTETGGSIASLFGLAPQGVCRAVAARAGRSEEHTSELQSLRHLVCRLLLEKKNHYNYTGNS